MALLEIVSAKLAKVNSKRILRVLVMTKRNKFSRPFTKASLKYLSGEYQKVEAHRIQNEISVYEIVDAFGAKNIETDIFQELNEIIHQIAKEEDALKTIANIDSDTCLLTNLWVWAHLFNKTVQMSASNTPDE